MPENVLSMMNICKSFGGVPMLKNVDFSLTKGRIHSLVGGNGAGKSTLMKIMTGVYTSDAGTIQINGKTVHITDPNVAGECGIRMIFQELSLIPTLTVAENIYINHEPKKNGFVDKKKMDEQAAALLREINVDVDVNRKVRDLGVGLCQLIEIAKALSSTSSILVMDEPTASLTEEETERLFSIMRRLKSRGTSIVYISHRLKEVLEIADEITVLRDGRIIRHDEKEHYTMDSLIDAIVGKGEGNRFLYQEHSGRISDEVLLDVRNLSWYGNPNKVSFQVHCGEVLGLIGLLGSGRTEIVETLFGIRKCKDAKITVKGKPVRIRKVEDAVKNGFALIPENRRIQGLALMQSIFENLILPSLDSHCTNRFIRLKECKSLAAGCIEEFNIKANSIQDKMLNLSGGNQQKNVIAKWFKTDPAIIMMDEPTAGVDIGAKTEIMEIIRRFVTQNRGVIFISSEMSEIMAICDRIIVLKDGNITQEIKRSAIKSEEELQHAIQV